jgi:hypothetical protein
VRWSGTDRDDRAGEKQRAIAQATFLNIFAKHTAGALMP